MEIGRLEFYATKPDRRGEFFGKIYPYNQALRNSIDGDLVFFHESCIPHTSALRTDRKLQGYRYATRLRGRTVYADQVYIAFDMPHGPTARKGDAAVAMLLEEANPDELPDLASVEGAGIKVALITAFPSVYTLSRIGLDVVQSDRVAQLKACWDGNGDDERIAFVRSLDSAALEKALIQLMGIDKRESPSLASPRRTRLALAARPDAALIPGVATMLTPGMWVDEFLAIMGEPAERNALMSSAQPPFRAYSLAKFAEQGGFLEDDLADDFIEAVRGSVGAGVAAECLRTVLTAQPRLALRGDVSAMLTPEVWVDELLDLMRNPAERSTLLNRARPAFRAHAIVRLAETGVSLDREVVHIFVDTVRKCADEKLVANNLMRVLSSQPGLALMDGVAEKLTPGMWVDELLGLMERPEDRHAFLAATKPVFRTYAVSRFVRAGGLLDEEDAESFAATIRGLGNKDLASESLRLVLNRQPRLALVGNIAAMLTPDTWVDGLLDLMSNQAGMQSLLAHAQPAFHAYATVRFVEAGGCLDETDIPNFVDAVRKCGETDLASKCVAAVLARQPRIALADGVASMLTPGMWTDGLLGIMGTQQGQMVLLASSRPDFRTYAVQKLIEAGIDLDIGILALCPLRTCPILLDQVQWSVDDVAYADAVGRWLQDACLSDVEGRRLIVRAAERMHTTGDLLSPTMWAHLPAVMRIRLCVFWSNHYARLDEYVMRGGIARICISAYENSWGGYDQVSKAALLLLALPLSKNPKKAFLDANDALIGEIVRQFNECDASALKFFALSDELQVLLQRCSSYQYVNIQSVRGFCDGRAWSKDDGTMGVWCHSGTDRPEEGRCECKSRPSLITVLEGKSGLRSNPENQFMADLLANTNEAMSGVNVGPWLEPGKMNISIGLVEYAYRVSGYVNKLASALPHMVCRKCGARLRLNYRYPREGLYGRSLDLPALSGPALSGTVCSCPNAGDGGEHDEDIYIHYCLNCHRVIDSRECRMRDTNTDGSPGMYLCMYCGASGAFKAATVCPSCGNTDLTKLRYFRGSMQEEKQCVLGSPPYGEILIACKVQGCMYDAREFNSEFE